MVGVLQLSYDLQFRVDDKGRLNVGRRGLIEYIWLNRDEAAVAAKIAMHYAETGEIEQTMKRWAIGWRDEGNSGYRLSAWDGFIEPNKHDDKVPKYFTTRDQAQFVRDAMYFPETDVSVLEVTLVERNGKLVEL